MTMILKIKNEMCPMIIEHPENAISIFVVKYS